MLSLLQDCLKLMFGSGFVEIIKKYEIDLKDLKQFLDIDVFPELKEVIDKEDMKKFFTDDLFLKLKKDLNAGDQKLIEDDLKLPMLQMDNNEFFRSKITNLISSILKEDF